MSMSFSNGASFGDSKVYGNSALSIGDKDVLPCVYNELLATGGDLSGARGFPA